MTHLELGLAPEMQAPPATTWRQRLFSAEARAAHRNRGKHRRRIYDFITVDVTDAGAQVRLPGHMADMWVHMPEELRERFRAAADRAHQEGS